VFVGGPVWERGDERDRVEALAFSPRDRLFEADAARRDVVRRGRNATEGQAPRRGGEPSVADEEERRAVGVLQGVAVRRGTDEAAAVRVFVFLGVGPGDGAERAAAVVQAGIIGLV